jgi:hypothetical protein
MSKFKLTPKRQVEIDKIENDIGYMREKMDKMSEFALEGYWWLPTGLKECKEESNAPSAEEVFFDYTERGIGPTRVSDKKRLAILIMGHKRINWK